MTRGAIVTAALVALAGCASSGPEVEPAELDGILYSVPSGWRSKDVSEHRTKIIVWTPEENPDKQSVTLMRAVMPALAKAGPDHIERLLSDAQGTLPAARFGKPIRFRTRHGLDGVRVEGELVPHGAKAAYRRFHAVLVDRGSGSVVHVLYTAARADRTAFDIVLDSLHRKAA